MSRENIENRTSARSAKFAVSSIDRRCTWCGDKQGEEGCKWPYWGVMALWCPGKGSLLSPEVHESQI